MSRRAAVWIVCLPFTCAAQAQAPVELTLKPGSKGAAEIETMPVLNAQRQWVLPNPSAFVITCKTGTDCSQVTLQAAGVDFSGTALPPDKRSFADIPVPQKGATLKVRHKGEDVASFELMQAGGGPQQRRETASTSTNLQELLTCDPRGVVTSYVPYDQRANRAWFVTTTLGTLLAVPTTSAGEVIDENDRVRVTILAHPDLIPLLRVKRTSAARTLGVLNIAGAGVSLERQSAVRCEALEAELHDFKAGTGMVKIAAQLGDNEVELGTFDFPVSPLHHGILSFGALSSDVVNDSFKLAPNDGQSVIVPGEEGDHETFYAVWYTPFVLGARDLEKSPDRWYQRINPSFGIVTNNLDEHALLGVSLDWGGFVLTVGSHFARTTVLSSGSGLQVGDPFPGAADTIPTSKEWKSSTYVGVSVDLRAAAALIKAAFSGGGS